MKICSRKPYLALTVAGVKVFAMLEIAPWLNIRRMYLSPLPPCFPLFNQRVYLLLYLLVGYSVLLNDFTSCTLGSAYMLAHFLVLFGLCSTRVERVLLDAHHRAPSVCLRQDLLDAVIRARPDRTVPLVIAPLQECVDDLWHLIRRTKRDTPCNDVVAAFGGPGGGSRSIRFIRVVGCEAQLIVGCSFGVIRCCKPESGASGRVTPDRKFVLYPGCV